jgi:hypothetical protein
MRRTEKKSVRGLTFVLLAAFTLRLAEMRGQQVSVEEAQRVAPYYRYWELADASPAAPSDVQVRLSAAIREAEQEFGGRGPALAQHFLHHIQASPGNTAFFFLFRAVGDLETARMLIQALLDPPQPNGTILGRDPGEIAVGIDAILKNDRVGSDPAIVEALQNTLADARQRPGGRRVAEIVTSLLGQCTDPRAASILQTLASDPEPAIRSAAVSALGNRKSPATAPTLERALVADSDPDARARAAVSLAQSGSPEAAASLQARLARETSPQVIDATVRALGMLRALPERPQACLELANRCWDASVAQPLFDCWRAAASRDAVVELAASGAWTVRALALHALVKAQGSMIQPVEPLVRTPPPLAPGNASRSMVMRPNQDPGRRPLPFAPPLRDRLLQSALEVLSQMPAGFPAPNTVSDSTVQLTRNAFWEISGRDMSVALRFADRIVPVSGRYASIGRFGESYDLASKDRFAYARLRRPAQAMAGGLAALLVSVFLAIKRIRRLAAAFVASLGAWAVWSFFQSDVRELPPLPLSFLTVSSLAFLSAGASVGVTTLLRTRPWLRVASGMIGAAIAAFVICGLTRSSRLFPIGSDGWELIFDPVSSVVLAVPVALVLSLGLESWKD